MLKHGLRNGTGDGLPGLFGVTLILGTLLTSSVACQLLSRNVKIEQIPSEPVIMTIQNAEYWCLEKRAFSAILQEASRDCD